MFQTHGPVAQTTELEFLKNLWGARHRVGIGLSYRPARATQAGGIDALESIPGLHKCLKIRAQISNAGR